MNDNWRENLITKLEENRSEAIALASDQQEEIERLVKEIGVLEQHIDRLQRGDTIESDHITKSEMRLLNNLDEAKKAMLEMCLISDRCLKRLRR